MRKDQGKRKFIPSYAYRILHVGHFEQNVVKLDFLQACFLGFL